MSVWFPRWGPLSSCKIEVFLPSLCRNSEVTQKKIWTKKDFVVCSSLGLRSMLKTNRGDMHCSTAWFITCQNVLKKKARGEGRKATTAEENIIILPVPQLWCQWCFKVTETKTFLNPISLNIISSSCLTLTALFPVSLTEDMIVSPSPKLRKQQTASF